MSQRISFSKPEQLDFLVVASAMWRLHYACEPGPTPSSFCVFSDHADTALIQETISDLVNDATANAEILSLIDRIVSMCESSESDELVAIGEAISSALEVNAALADADDDDDDDSDDSDD